MTIEAPSLPFAAVPARGGRDAVHRDLDRSLFVEAGAGTGKTTVLVRRVVELFATGRVAEPNRLVAITFTEAAAAELRHRIRRELDRAARAGADGDADDRSRRCRHAVEHIDDAQITTIHGFAQRILASHPLEARLPPVLEVCDEVEATVVFDDRWRRFLDDLFADPAAEPDLERAFTLGLTTVHLRAIAEAFHDRWDRLVGVAFEAPLDGAVDLDAVRVPLRQAVTACGHRADTHPEDRLVQCVATAAEALAILDTVPAPPGGSEPSADLDALATLDAVYIRKPGSVGSGDIWGDDKARAVQALRHAIAARDTILGAARRVVLERLLGRLAGFTLAGVDERRNAGRLEFHDLLVFTRDLLRHLDRVRVAVATGIDAILIDEFQDTDPLQLEIALLLAAADPAAPPPDRPEAATLADGKLLVVGDPKQSIYRFRGADIGVWDRTQALFVDRLVRLNENFRSVPQIIAWVNQVFGRLLEGRAGQQPTYVPLAATRARLTDEPTVVVLGEPTVESVTEVRRREASDLARLIATMKAESWRRRDPDDATVPAGATRALRYADVAVLVPTRTPLSALEQALDRGGVPYRIESRSLVWDTDDVRELLAILAAIDDPADEVAVVAALRSPAFACPDDVLADYRLGGGSWDYLRPPPPDLPADHPVVEALGELARLHRLRWWLPPNQLIETVVRQRRLVELTMAQRRPRDHWRRLRFVVDQARGFVEAGGHSLAGFVAWATVQAEAHAQAVDTVVPEPDDDAVRILTVHGAKGLEFPVVVLAGLQSGVDTQPPAVLWGPNRPEVARGRRGGARFETAGYEALFGEARQADDFEARRLLYVAATRARDHLVVSLHHKVTGGQPSYAQRLFEVCVELEGLWRPAKIPEQLLLDLSDDQPPVSEVPVRDVAARRHWIMARQRLLAATHASGPITASALADEEIAPVAPAVGVGGAGAARAAGGAAVGRAVHELLRAVDLADPHAGLDRLAVLHARAEGVAESAPDVARLAASCLEAPVMRAARAAHERGRCWREVYVAAPVDGGPLVEGYVDLLYETDEGELVVVDYKTDRARGDADLDAALARYRHQGAAYALALEQALGRRVSRCVFVFCRPDGAAERELTDVAAAVEEVRLMTTR